jgi:Nuclease subunit of the excinuclease complex
MSETLYRFYDSDHKLLYVGISCNWQQRLKQHYKDSDFHDEAHYITLEHYNTRLEVEDAEFVAIQTEKPKYNKSYNPDYEKPTDHAMKIKAWVYKKSEPDPKHEALVKELQELFLQDPLWQRKSTGPVVHHLLINLPFWATKHNLDCDECIKVYHSRQVASWAAEFRRVIRNAN